MPNRILVTPERINQVSTELNQISIKFRTTDESNTGLATGGSIASNAFAVGAVMGAMATGIGAVGVPNVRGTAIKVIRAYWIR